MKYIMVGILSLILLSLVAFPVSAFTAEQLDIQIYESGAAAVNFTYSLSWIEQIAVFPQLADPAQIFVSAMEQFTGRHVENVSMTSSTLQFLARGFAQVTEGDAGVRNYTTPGLQFRTANEAIRQYWFAPILQVDLSPARTTLRFPDGEEREWIELEEIPSVTHTI